MCGSEWDVSDNFLWFSWAWGLFAYDTPSFIANPRKHSSQCAYPAASDLPGQLTRHLDLGLSGGVGREGLDGGMLVLKAIKGEEELLMGIQAEMRAEIFDLLHIALEKRGFGSW